MFEGDPKRKYGDPMKYVEHQPVRMYAPNYLSDEERELLGLLRGVWEIPTRNPEHLRNWKVRLQREWPEMYETLRMLFKQLELRPTLYSNTNVHVPDGLDYHTFQLGYNGMTCKFQYGRESTCNLPSGHPIHHNPVQED